LLSIPIIFFEIMRGKSKLNLRDYEALVSCC